MAILPSPKVKEPHHVQIEAAKDLTSEMPLARMIVPPEIGCVR